MLPAPGASGRGGILRRGSACAAMRSGACTRGEESAVDVFGRSLRAAIACGALLAAATCLAAEPATGPGPSAPAPSTAAAAASPAFLPGEEIDLALDYLHLRAGHVKLRLGRPEGAIWPVICQAQTDGAASLLDIREHFVSYWDADAHASRGSELNAIEV